MDKFAGQKRIKVLAISGGCCHDYPGQDKILMDLMGNQLPVDWTISYGGGTSSDYVEPLYGKPGWDNPHFVCSGRG